MNDEHTRDREMFAEIIYMHSHQTIQHACTMHAE